MGAVDPPTLRAWLTARSLSRGLPAPYPDRGGFRVDTGLETETSRWVFPEVCDGLVELAQSIEAPLHPLKLCGPMEQLVACTPERWIAQPQAYFMRGPGAAVRPAPPAGYGVRIEEVGPRTTVRIVSASGEEAPLDHAVETADAFVYDRIATAPDHRRRGLGRVLMQTLGAAKRNAATPDLLAATEMGRALYLRLGWEVLAPYSTVTIPPPLGP